MIAYTSPKFARSFVYQFQSAPQGRSIIRIERESEAEQGVRPVGATIRVALNSGVMSDNRKALVGAPTLNGAERNGI